MERNQVFICYSHADNKWRQRIQTTLAPLLHLGTIRAWDDTQILAGNNWQQKIDEALSKTRVGLVLVSAEALSSDFIMTTELPALEAAARAGVLRLLWVPIRSCLWDLTPLRNIQAVSDPTRPLAALPPHRQDAVITEICRKIAEAYASFGTP